VCARFYVARERSEGSSGITINGNEERGARLSRALPSEIEEPERWEVNEGGEEEKEKERTISNRYKVENGKTRMREKR